MRIDEILTLTSWSDRLTELKVDINVAGSNIIRTPLENWKYFKGDHPILTDPDRQDVYVDIYKTDLKGVQILDENDRPIISGSKKIKRTRKVLNYQQQIVETAVAMVFGAPVDLVLNNSDKSETINKAFQEFKIQWNKCKMDSFLKKLAKNLFIETKNAVIFYMEEGDPDKDIKLKLLCFDKGDYLWMHLDDNDKCDAITRVFVKRMIVEGKVTEVEITQVYTALKLYEKIGEVVTETVNPYGKIPIAFFAQNETEWQPGKELITKMEYTRSQLSDVNTRVGNPAVVIDGEIASMPDYDADVKTFNTIPVQSGETLLKSSVYLLESKGAPESVKMEIEMDKFDMYKFTWPDLSFLMEAIKTGALSGAAIRLMFTNAFAKMANKYETFEDLGRIISIMKAVLQTAKGGVFDQLDISVRFNSILPDNIVELTDMYSTAVNAGLTSKQNAISQLPYNENAQTVIDEVLAEQTAIASQGLV
jgi:hypothetical protein